MAYKMKTNKHILRGPEPHLKYPEDMTIGQLLYEKLITHGDKVAQVCS